MEREIDQCGFYETQIPNKERLRFSGNQLVWTQFDVVQSEKSHRINISYTWKKLSFTWILHKR